ncbi:hypothetical protein Nepgr_011371 [Nepenthes gracilis]|uniref:CBF1-interacting co-repressor CIR N-terminal domain-containing protein n=1 Tax=Nepenthes gracilis TaxID=150966 RepID=A0AAD3SDY2_NEPGR|nr:hypothetical protein Nepgr_011371 [Nepenthes gracilis]
MGGHGGLNILPQKRWNVYNFENREKVRRDEEAAAREEQTKREEARKRDAEFRIERLRRARGLAPSTQAATASEPAPAPVVALKPQSDSDSKHINLFDGIKIFDPIVREKDGEDEGSKRKKMKEAAAPIVVGPEDEKYRLGYGIAGKGVKAPWYMMRPIGREQEERYQVGSGEEARAGKEQGRTGGKKTVEELREERLKREKREKERERALLLEKGRRSGDGSKDRGNYRRV